MKTFIAILFAVLLAQPAVAAPFGLWRIPVEMQGKVPFTLNALAFDPQTDAPGKVLAALDSARAAKMHVFISLVAFADMKENPPGNFSAAAWRARYAAWCNNGKCLNLKPYVDDHTLLGVHIFEYTNEDHARQRMTPGLDEIRQVGAMVKSLWPYLPIAIDAPHPCMLTGTNWRGAVDIVMITFFTLRQTDFTHGETLLGRETTCANAAGLRYTIGPNPFGGTQQGLAPTSLATFRHFTEYALQDKDSMGTIVWRWWPGDTPTVSNGRQSFANFWSEKTNPGIGAAMKEIEACAAHPDPDTCPHGSPGGFPE